MSRFVRSLPIERLSIGGGPGREFYVDGNSRQIRALGEPDEFYAFSRLDKAVEWDRIANRGKRAQK
jgi:hypothetical protein